MNLMTYFLVQGQVVNLTSNVKTSENHPKSQGQDQIAMQPQTIQLKNNMVFIKEDKFTKMIDNQREAFELKSPLGSNKGLRLQGQGNNPRNAPVFLSPVDPNEISLPENQKTIKMVNTENNYLHQVDRNNVDPLRKDLKVPNEDSRIFARDDQHKGVDRKALGVTDTITGMKIPYDESIGLSKFVVESAIPTNQESFQDLQTQDRVGTGVQKDAQPKKMVFDPSTVSGYPNYLKERFKSAEILRGMPYKTEYELIPFNRFAFNRIFMVDPGLGKRVVEKPIGSKKKDLSEILEHALTILNQNRTQHLYSHDDFVEGVYRTDPAAGSHYELYFLEKNDQGKRYRHSYKKISIVRPFAPPLTLKRNDVKTSHEWINIILPLSGRLETFRIFMDQFANVCIKQDKRIYLTVVYFGNNGLKEVKHLLGKMAKTYKYKHIKLVTLNETFTRGRALQIGALNWKNGDVLLFFCDVDVVFTADFLERCRLNSEKGQRVYYPIVFSLYNPNIVYSLQDAPMPSFHDQLVLSKDTGFWRDFGYGMTCQYRSDFLKIKGFDEQITGWGGEDVFLYQKFVRSDYFVLRATDPAIFHLWHEKYCDPNISPEQYRSCIRSKALNEASHAQLGLLAFKDEINVHRNVSGRNSIKNGAIWRDNSQQNKKQPPKPKS